MVRQLAKSIREYKRASIATPLLVSCEVLMECTIPFIIAQLVNEVKKEKQIHENRIFRRQYSGRGH